MKEAHSHFDENLRDLKTPSLYNNWDRYRQWVMDVNWVISVSCAPRFSPPPMPCLFHHIQGKTPIFLGSLRPTMPCLFHHNPFV